MVRMLWVCALLVVLLAAVPAFVLRSGAAAELIEAAVFPLGGWIAAAAVLVGIAHWVISWSSAAQQRSAVTGTGLVGVGLAAMSSPLFALPWMLLLADGGYAPTTFDWALQWLWVPGLVALVIAVIVIRRGSVATARR